MQTPHLIINADDFGMTEPVARGIVEAYQAGSLTDASALILWPACARATDMVYDSGLPLGLHIDLTSDYATKFDGALCGQQGKIFRAVIGIEQGKQTEPSFSAAELNIMRHAIERQVELFQRTFGLPPTHLDHHHPLHLLSAFRKTYVEIAQKYGFPIRWYAAEPCPVPHPDHIILIRNQGTQTRDNLLDYLANLQPGTTEIVVHPGYASSNLRSPYTTGRELELAALLDTDVIATLKGPNLQMRGYRRI